MLAKRLSFSRRTGSDENELFCKSKLYLPARQKMSILIIEAHHSLKFNDAESQEDRRHNLFGRSPS